MLTIQDLFAIRNRGLIVIPLLDATESRADKFAVELRRPDGSTLRATALAQIPFVNPPPPIPQTHLLLLDVTKEDVPLGTQIWTLD